jgi:hypothetical protein
MSPQRNETFSAPFYPQKCASPAKLLGWLHHCTTYGSKTRASSRILLLNPSHGSGSFS